jgi:hypothetical protein
MMPILEPDPPNGQAGRREQRSDQRRACNVSVEWACFNAVGRFSGRMADASARGACVESDQPVIPGTAVLVRLMSSDGSGLDRAVHSLMLAEVKWCRALPWTASWQYRFGMKCYEYF